MNTIGVREVSIRYRRRNMALDLDLNLPLSETSSDHVAAPSDVSLGLQTVQTSQQGEGLPIPLIDVDAIDDEVLLTSPRAFAEAKTNSRRDRGRPAVVDVDVGYPVYSRKRCRRVPPNQTIINCDHYINLETSGNSKPPEPIPPPELTFNCPICLGPLREEMSTKCGHIFCKACIKTAISVQSKCPTCRKRVTTKDIIRVYLPTTS